MLLYERRLRAAERNIAVSFLAPLGTIVAVIGAGFGWLPAPGPWAALPLLLCMLLPIHYVLAYARDLRWAQRSIGPCRGCLRPSERSPGEHEVHTCCPYQQHAPGTCTCDP